LSGDARVRHVESEADGLRVTLGDGLSSSELNRALVVAGVGVSRLEPARTTLEDTFLAVTSRLEAAE
jgi:hypothetical protein